jgi:hypothetical protein
MTASQSATTRLLIDLRYVVVREVFLSVGGILSGNSSLLASII